MKERVSPPQKKRNFRSDVVVRPSRQQTIFDLMVLLLTVGLHFFFNYQENSTLRKTFT